MHAQIERGTVLEINNELTINKHYTVLYCGVPVGTAKDNLCWFSSNPRKPEHSEINQVVYLGDYRWGVRELILPVDEFKSFDSSVQEEILSNFLDMQKQFLILEKRNYFND